MAYGEKQGQATDGPRTITIVSPYLTAAMDDINFYNSQMLNLSRVLAEKGYNIHIITTAKYAHCGELYGEDENVSVNAWGHFVLTPQLLLMSPLMLFSRELREADAIQVSEDYQPTSVMLAIYSKVINKPLVIFSGVYSEPHRPISRLLFRLLRSVCLPIIKCSSPVIVAKTESAVNYSKASGYTTVRLAHVGVDTRVFSPGSGDDFRKKRGIDPDSFLVLYVGRLERYRNPKILIELLEASAALGRNLQVLVIGTGLQTEYLRSEAIRRGVGDKLHMIDRLPNIEVRDAMRASNAFVLPMKKDTLFNFGMVLLEAMSTGLPTVSVPVPAAKDIIEHSKNGFIVPFEDKKELFKSVERLMDDPELSRRVGAEARRTIVSMYDWHVVSKAFEDAYREACAIKDIDAHAAIDSPLDRTDLSS